MARVNITAPSAATGALATPTEFTVDGIAVPNNGKRFVLVTNGSVASINVTEQTNATVEGLTVPDRTTAVAAGEVRRFGPWSSLFAQDDGAVYIDSSAATSVDYTVFDVSPA